MYILPIWHEPKSGSCHVWIVWGICQIHEPVILGHALTRKCFLWTSEYLHVIICSYIYLMLTSPEILPSRNQTPSLQEMKLLLLIQVVSFVRTLNWWIFHIVANSYCGKFSMYWLSWAVRDWIFPKLYTCNRVPHTSIWLDTDGKE